MAVSQELLHFRSASVETRNDRDFVNQCCEFLVQLSAPVLPHFLLNYLAYVKIVAPQN